MNCASEFTTHESVDAQKVIKVIGDGDKETAFSRARLLISILKVCDHLNNSGEAAFMLHDAIEQKLLRTSAANGSVVTKKDIVSLCCATLKNFDAAAYVKYLTYHSPLLDMKQLKKKLR